MLSTSIFLNRGPKVYFQFRNGGIMILKDEKKCGKGGAVF